MIPLSSHALGRLVAARAGLGPDPDDAALLAAARSPGQKMAALLTSARDLEGGPMPDDWREALRRQRVRTAFYARHVDELTALVPGTAVFKGRTLARDYPSGLVRGAGDVDIRCASPEVQWSAAQHLVTTGWHVKAFTLFDPAATGPEAVVVFGHDDIPGDHQLLGIALSTSHLLTDLWSPPLALLDVASERATSLACLLAEQWERPILTRDLVDYCVVTAAASSADLAELAALARRARIRHLWSRLRSQCRAQGLTVDHSGPGRGAVVFDAAARSAHALRRRVHPVRLAARVAGWTVDEDRGASLDALSDQIHARIGVRRVLDSGMPAFGVQLDGRRSPGLLVEHRAGRSVALTPLGTFRLVVGSCTDEPLPDASPSIQAIGLDSNPGHYPTTLEPDGA